MGPTKKQRLYVYIYVIYFSQAENYSNEPTDQWYHHPGSERIHLSTEEEDGGGTFDSDSVLLGFLLRFFGDGEKYTSDLGSFWIWEVNIL